MENHAHKHHILSNKATLIVGGALFCLTGLTVLVAGIDLGPLNFLVAMVISTVKASLVALFFMNLLYDRRENSVIFGTAFLFLAIFMTLTSCDLFFRGNVYLHGPIKIAEAKSKLVKPWVSTPALVAHGKELFEVNCVACHGPHGQGNGPAAASLNPHPRNFTSTTEKWVNGRKPTMVFKTLKEGVPGSAMASFATLPADDRWALAAYVLSLNPNPPEKDTSADFAKIGINPNATGAAAAPEEQTVPVEFAMQKLAQPALKPVIAAQEHVDWSTPGAQLYRQNCVSCHGDQGQGGIHVRTMALAPSPAWVITEPLRGEAVSSEAAFNKAVTEGIPGNFMPNFGQLSGAELRELHGFVQGLAKH